MCNFVKSNGEQCKLARNKERCAKHPIIIDQEIIVAESNIVEVEMPPQTQVNTAVVAEVDMPAPSVIEPVEASSMKVKEVQELEKSNVEPVIADATVYEEDQSSNLELNNSRDEEEDAFFFENYVESNTCIQHDVKDCMDEFPFGVSDTIDAFENYLFDHNIEVAISEKTDKSVYEDGFRYCFYIQQGSKTLIHYYCKTEQMMKNIPIMINEVNITEYYLQNALYDQRLYKLCCILKRSWFSDNNNTWNLAGALFRKQHVDLGLMRKTYLCILHTMTDRFDQAAALKVFNDWKTSKYHPKLTESQIKSIAGGCDQTAYNQWKAEYEPKEIKEKKEKKKKDDEFTVPHFPKFHIYYEKGELPPIFDCKNTETYLDVISLKKRTITMERLYKFIKDNIAYILQGGNGYYLTKNRDAFGEIDYEVVKDIRQFDMVFNINNAIELDDDGLIETDNTEFDTDSIMSLPISDVIHHYRDDITYGKVDFMPYNAKTGACDTHLNTFDWNSNDVFNKFNGFVHTYDPNFVVDESKFKCFGGHIKHIWCSGRDDLTDHIMKLFAWQVQKPYQKSGACVVLEGEEGCGKNIVFEILKYYVIGTRYCLETPKIKILTGRFNAGRENKILTILNEAANVKQSSHEDQDELKDVITEPTCLIERKGIDPYRVKDCNNLFIASNNSYSVKASKQMRRFLYLLCKSDRIGDKAYFKAILDEFRKTDSGVHLYHYLMSIDLEGFHPQDDAPMTQEKSDMQKTAIEKPVQWLVECVTNGTSNSIFNNAQIENTPGKLEFVSIDDMLSKFTKWMIEESKDASSYSRDRFSKTLTKFLGMNYKKQVHKIRQRGYDLSVNSLKDTITKYTRRNDLFDDE